MTFIAETTDLLARTPAVLRALLTGLPEAWTDTPDALASSAEARPTV
jgi:hypothetical protein